MLNIGARKLLLREPLESFDTGIVKKLKKFETLLQKDLYLDTQSQIRVFEKPIEF